MKFLILCTIILMFPKYAHAYLDPATGAMIINALVVGFITLLAFFRRQLTRFLVWAGLKKAEADETEEVQNVEEGETPSENTQKTDPKI